jgi:DNA-binding CsgD family transcriptional regulator
MARLSRGSTSHDIAEALAIELFTVKNHLKRSSQDRRGNRTQAVARFNQAVAGRRTTPA